MHHRRRNLFTLVCALSLLLAAAVAFLWVKTFDDRWRLFGFSRDEEKYSLLSEAGQLVIVGPPREEVIDPLGRKLIWKMSNADFEWSEIGSDYVGGEVRRDTPTWLVYQRFVEREKHGLGLEPAMRIWIAQARNDPQRFVPAHMLLMFAANTKRTRSPVSRQKWGEVAYRFEADGARIPEMQMRAEPGSKRPDFARRWDLQQEWSDVMETPRAALFHGWLWLGAMALPLAWVARPRWRKRTPARWITNGTALASALVLATAAAMWVRSWVVDEQFIFARRPRAKVTSSFADIDSIRSIGSTKGKLM